MRREALLRERDQLESQRRRSVPPQGADPHPPPLPLCEGRQVDHLKEEIAPSPAGITSKYLSLYPDSLYPIIRIHFIRLSGFSKSEDPELCPINIFPAPYGT